MIEGELGVMDETTKRPGACHHCPCIELNLPCCNCGERKPEPPAVLVPSVPAERWDWHPTSIEEAKKIQYAGDLYAVMPREQLLLRQMLFSAYAASDPAAYGDDGELQYNRHPHIDFLRDSPENIGSKIWEHTKRKLLAAAPVGKAVSQ